MLVLVERYDLIAPGAWGYGLAWAGGPSHMLAASDTVDSPFFGDPTLGRLPRWKHNTAQSLAGSLIHFPNPLPE